MCIRDRMGISVLGGFLVCGHIISWAINRQASSVYEGKKAPVRVFLLSMAGILTVYWVYLFSSAYPGFFNPDTSAAFAEIQNGVYSFRNPVYYTFFIDCLLYTSGRGA